MLVHFGQPAPEASSIAAVLEVSLDQVSASRLKGLAQQQASRFRERYASWTGEALKFSIQVMLYIHSD